MLHKSNIHKKKRTEELEKRRRSFLRLTVAPLSRCLIWACNTITDSVCVPVEARQGALCLYFARSPP